MTRPRELWLNCERIGLGESVIFPATADDVVLLLEFLEADAAERARLACQLRERLDQQRSLSPFARRAVPCRRPLSLSVLLPWRLAAWLRTALELSAEEVDALRQQLTAWLAGDSQTTCCATAHGGVREKSRDQRQEPAVSPAFRLC